jgi:hypothetical protein
MQVASGHNESTVCFQRLSVRSNQKTEAVVAAAEGSYDPAVTQNPHLSGLQQSHYASTKQYMKTYGGVGV